MLQINILVFFTLCLNCLGIIIPMKQGQFRCMLVYSMGNDETIKIDINFPFIQDWNTNQYYYLTLRNTMNQELQKQNVTYGRFLRQVNIFEKTIYEICFQFRSNRKINSELLVDYNADTYFMVNHDKTKIPDNLLKSQKIKQTYLKTLQLSKLAFNFMEIQKEVIEKQENIFEQNQNSETKMIILGLFQIMLIIGAGYYQLRVLKQEIIENKY